MGTRPAVAIMSFVLVVLPLPIPALGQGPPINTDTPILLGLEGKAVMLRTVLVRKSHLYQDGNRIADPLQREVTVTMVPVAVPYNVTSDFLVGGMIPLMNLRTRSLSGSSSSFGVSDISIFAKYLFLQVDGLQETFRILAKGNIKFPTGDKNQGLGTGTVDYSIGAVVAWIGKRVGIYGDVAYSFNGTSDGVSSGNSLTVNVGVGFRVVPGVYETYPTDQWNAYLEFNGKYSAESRLDGQPLNHTGGNVVFVSPGIQYIPSRFFLLEASVQVPAVQNLNGTQLGTNLIGLIGARVLLD